MKKQIKKQQSGRSMIEMVGVLAVMGLITAGAFVLISSASSSSKRNRVVDDVMEIVSGVRSLYAVQEQFPAANSFPQSSTLMNAINKVATGPYTGGEYSVARASATTFTVSLSKVSKDDCGALELKEWKGRSTSAAPACADDTSGTQTFTITFDK